MFAINFCKPGINVLQPGESKLLGEKIFGGCTAIQNNRYKAKVLLLFRLILI